MRSNLAIVALALILSTSAAFADPGTLTVHVDQPGTQISPVFNGLMIEDINHSIDGGLYAELLTNRSFAEDSKVPVHWSLVQSPGAQASMELVTDQPVNAALGPCLKVTSDGKGRVGVANHGYWGIPILPQTKYRVSFYAKATFDGPLRVALESSDNSATYAETTVPKVGSEWQRYTLTLKTGKVDPTTHARFVIDTASAGDLWLNLVSLFPPTYHNRPNGTRPDLMDLIGDMKPAFLRLPGGNYLEGPTVDNRFAWKTTIGDISQRPGHMGPWGYRSSDGMGLLEYLEWCEDLHMSPLLAVYAGYSLNNYHNPNPQRIAPGAALEPFVQEAVDEIEYAMGDTSTRWGKQRALDGHPAPFKIDYVEIGNEDWFDTAGSYDARFAQFFDAIRAKYPSIKLIATANVNSRTPDIVDEHFYLSPANMERGVTHYDNYSRTGPKVLVGEWAAQEGNPTPDMNSALGDASWLVGLERNADVVVMQSYAPLLVNVNQGAAQWGTNLIGFDAMHSYGSPSYYVLKMFGENAGQQLLPVDVDAQTAAQAEPAPLTGGVGVGAWNTQTEFKDIKVTSGDTVLCDSDANAPNWTYGAGQWSTDSGVLQQTSQTENNTAITGDAGWGDYTYTLKARKTAGREGFLILFHARSANDLIWWNIGGWGNSRTQLERNDNGEKSPLGKSSNFTVETGRWYDIKIEVKGHDIRCSIDGNLITETTDDLPAPPGPVFASASRNGGDVIVKVVNVGTDDQHLKIDLGGAQHVGAEAALETIAGDPSSTNSIDDPKAVVPVTKSIPAGSSSFDCTFPAHSVSVLRVKAE